MENKNLNDIVIDENDNKKKTQLKNILTLLALLFIILVISIVITKLILGENSDTAVEKPVAVESTQENTETDTNSTIASTVTAAATTGLAAASLNSNDGTATTTQPAIDERNNTKPKSTSSSKNTLRDYSNNKKEVAKTSTKTSSSSYVQPKYISTTERAKTTTAPVAKTTTETKNYNPSRGYYIKVGTYEDPAAAIDRIKAIQLNYRTIKSSEGLTRVLIGPFYSQKDAEDHLAKAKESVAKDAYITKIK